MSGGLLMLMSGGVDSSALAYLIKPDGLLFIDYGQRPKDGEFTAANAVAASLGMRLDRLDVDCSTVGSGLLSGSRSIPGSPSPEWWPFRNQLLVTLAAAWGISRGYASIALGLVSTDSDRHADGSSTFVAAINRLLSVQEGSMRLVAPSLAMSTAELLARSPIPDSALAWTHSCHRAAIACGSCPGCLKRLRVLEESGRLLG
jgi:7-cyano-7-deazaguanine synthase